MTAYALRLANGMDTAPRCRAGDALGLTPAGPLQARNGLRPDGGGVVTVVEGTMMVDVSPLMGWVDGDTSDAQGGYPFVSDDTVQLTLTDGDPGADRTDTIVARVQDTAYDGGGVTAATVEVVPGVPGAGAPALPPTCIPLRDLLVPAGLSAGTGGLSSSNLGSDRRTYTAAAGGVVNVTGVADRDAMGARPGQMVWRLDTAALEVFDGTRWRPTFNDPVQRVRKTASQTVLNSATRINDDHLKFVAAANTSYLVDAFLMFSGNASAMDAAVDLGLPSGTWSGGAVRPALDIPSGDFTHETAWSAVVDVASFGLSGGVAANDIITIWRFAATADIGATGGTVNLRWAQNVATSVNLRLNKGSWLRAERF